MNGRLPATAIVNMRYTRADRSSDFTSTPPRNNTDFWRARASLGRGRRSSGRYAWVWGAVEGPGGNDPCTGPALDLYARTMSTTALWRYRRAAATDVRSMLSNASLDIMLANACTST